MPRGLAAIVLAGATEYHLQSQQLAGIDAQDFLFHLLRQRDLLLK